MVNRGFITIASDVGNYQKMARILCISAKEKTNGSIKFAILTNRKTDLLDVFDYIIVDEALTKSANDKLRLFEISPFNETIYLDSDVIVYNDLNKLWDYFENASSVSAFGELFYENNDRGWYSFDSLNQYKNKVNYIQNLHGGIYYFRNNEIARQVKSDCEEIMTHYQKFNFRDFKKPSDEPPMALSMAINKCKVVPLDYNVFCWWRRAKHVKADYFSGKFDYVIDDFCANNVIVFHFGTSRTIFPLYLIESKKVDYYYEHRRKRSFLYSFCVYLTSYIRSFFLILMNLKKIINKKNKI